MAKAAGRPKLSREDSVPITVRVPKNYRAALENLAAQAGMTLPEYIRSEIFSWLVLQFDSGKQDILPVPKTWEEYYRVWGSHFILMGHRAFQMAETQHLMGVKPNQDLLETRLERQVIFERHPERVQKFVEELRQLEAEELRQKSNTKQQ